MSQTEFKSGDEVIRNGNKEIPYILIEKVVESRPHRWRMHKKGDSTRKTYWSEEQEIKKFQGKETETEKEPEQQIQPGPTRGRESLSLGGLIPRVTLSSKGGEHHLDKWEGKNAAKTENLAEQFITLNMGRAKGVVPRKDVFSGVRAWVPEDKNTGRSKGCIRYLVTAFGGEMANSVKDATHIICDKPPKRLIGSASSTMMVHSDWLLHRLSPSNTAWTEEHFSPSTYSPTPSFSKWVKEDQQSRCVVKRGKFFDYLETAWPRDLSPLLAKLEEGIVRKAVTWGSWVRSVEDVIKKYIDFVLETCFEYVGIDDMIVNTEFWLESVNIDMGHGPVEYIVTYRPKGSLPVILIVEAKRKLNQSVYPQVIGEILCAFEINQTLPKPKEVFAILTNMTDWQFFRYNGKRNPLPIVWQSSEYQFAELRDNRDGVPVFRKGGSTGEVLSILLAILRPKGPESPRDCQIPRPPQHLFLQHKGRLERIEIPHGDHEALRAKVAEILGLQEAPQLVCVPAMGVTAETLPLVRDYTTLLPLYPVAD